MRVGDQRATVITEWAGPWPIAERWWDPDHARRRAASNSSWPAAGRASPPSPREVVGRRLATERQAPGTGWSPGNGVASGAGQLVGQAEPDTTDGEDEGRVQGVVVELAAQIRQVDIDDVVVAATPNSSPQMLRAAPRGCSYLRVLAQVAEQVELDPGQVDPTSMMRTCRHDRGRCAAGRSASPSGGGPRITPSVIGCPGRRSNARRRAASSIVEIGLLMTSSAPAHSRRTRSSSSLWSVTPIR